MELSVDQLRIINSKTTGQSLIKGVAGSGKTTVALFKLVAMQQQKELLYLTSSRSASTFIQEIAPQYLQMSDQEKDPFFDISVEMIPLEAIKDTNMKFMLEVSGNSMIDFNIFDGDRIVVKKQSVAAEGSIIVGGDMTMNEATVKQFHYDGEDIVILHPGNKKYEDIVVKIEDFYINGIVVGVLRKQ